MPSNYSVYLPIFVNQNGLFWRPGMAEGAIRFLLGHPMNLKRLSISELRSLKCELKERIPNPLYILDRTTIDKRLKDVQSRIDELIELAFVPEKQTKAFSLSQDVLSNCVAAFNNITGHRLRSMDEKATRQLTKLFLEGYTTLDFDKAVKSAFADMSERETVKHLTPEFITRPAQFSKYLNMKEVKPKPLFIPA